MANRQRKLAGEKHPVDTNRRLAGTPLTDNVIALNAPLTVTSPSLTLASRGVKIFAVRKRGLYDKRAPLKGMRIMFSVDFYDTITKEPLSPTLVVLKLTKPDGTTVSNIAFVENTGRPGYYTTSYVPQDHGEWKCKVTQGTAAEIIDDTKFYVL